MREQLLALAGELEEYEGDTCEGCAAYEQPECRGYLPCTEIVAKYCARKIREAVERDGEGATTVSAYDLLPEEDRKALAWVREIGGVDAAKARMMPEGCEWPRYEDGTPVWFGDEASRLGEVFKVSGIGLYFDGSYALNFRAYSKDERVKRPAPKALDADGAEIGIGDKLYDIETGCARIVSAINANGTVEFEGYEDRGWFTWFLTHRAPVLAADGKPLEVGQTVWDTNGDELVIGAFEDGGHTVTCRYADVGDAIPVHGMWSPSQLTHKRPVLDADGVPIREGDTVYKLEDSRPYTVKRIDGEHVYINAGGKAFDIWTFPGKLTHEQPDTWERLEKDANLGVNDYRERYGIKRHDGMTWPQLVREDLVRRARALAGVSE